MKTKDIFLSLIISLSLFFFVITMLIISFIFVLHGDSPNGLVTFFIRYHIHFMIVLGILGIGVGVVSYYGFTAQRKNLEQSNQFSKQILYKFLDETEKKVLDYLLENGKTTQANISRLEGLGKVKSFRTLQRLQQKNLIELESYGKTNRVSLRPEIADVLKTTIYVEKTDSL